MAGKLTTTVHQINDSATATNNFVLKADNLGGLKLSRGNDGATSSDILTITSGDQVALPANTTNKLVSASGSAPVYGCRAWCVFNGVTTGTNAPIAGGNVTSVTRNSAGNYTINFTVAMQDANYAITGSTNSNLGSVGLSNNLTSNVVVTTYNSSFVATDFGVVSVVIFR